MFSGYVYAFHYTTPGSIAKHYHLCFFILYLNCGEKKTKILKKRRELAHFKKI